MPRTLSLCGREWSYRGPSNVAPVSLSSCNCAMTSRMAFKLPSRQPGVIAWRSKKTGRGQIAVERAIETAAGVHFPHVTRNFSN
jgi:hypothetical protein